ncbi:hypothetical protein [Streptomyces sp. SID3212]|uniref:hypothetical protein n=1 Tax=Streptomyces sp. SID3212 TaxID=2690259 RepID=UPI0013CC2BF6|nr:hypothetical protein [Streptomyces sp. SID3212]MYV58011.1 hypothetical protein [Streptomyces sp. SID3212]
MSTPNPFVRASSNEIFSPSKHPEWHNKLFIIRPNYVEMVTFKPEEGPKKIVNSHVVILDLIAPDGLPTVISGAAIGGAGIVPQIENHLGEAVLGRLGMGQPQPGKNPAFKLETNFSDADAELAGRYIQQFPLPPVPTPPPPAPVQAPQAPFGGPAAPAAGQWGQAPQAPAQQQFSPPPADVWGGVNAAPAPQAAASAWGQAPAQQPPAAAPAQWQAPAPAAPPAPAQQQWGQAPPAPDPMAGAQQWGNTNQPAPAVAQDPQLVAFLQSRQIDVAPNGVPMSNEQMRMIASTIPQ